MCDETNHPGYFPDPSITRRSFVLTMTSAAAAAVASPAQAANAVSKDVTVKTSDGSADSVLFHPAGSGRWPAVLVWPDAFGLRPVFRDLGRRLASQGYVVLVPNPFYRAGPAPVPKGPIDFNKPADRDKLMALINALTPAVVDRDAAAYLDFLDSQPQTDRARKAGVQGYCMGGSKAFRTAALRPDRIGAVASFHGGGLVTKEPSSPHLLIPKTRASYLVAIARNDDAKEPEAKTVLKQAFAAAKRPATVEVYAADHGWCVPGNPAYDQPSAERAWAELTRLYATNLT